MASFIHLTDARHANKLYRNGIRPAQSGDHARAVFCVPVVANFQTTFQWLRELRRRGFRKMCAIQFKIPDAEIVSVGRYAQPHIDMTAAEAVATFRRLDDARGFEVLIVRAIKPKEITRLRSVPQVVGWRYYPEAKGKLPLWPRKGEIKGSRIRRSIIAR